MNEVVYRYEEQQLKRPPGTEGMKNKNNEARLVYA